MRAKRAYKFRFRWGKKTDLFLREHYLEFSDNELSIMMNDVFGYDISVKKITSRRRDLGLFKIRQQGKFLCKAPRARSLKVDGVRSRYVFSEIDINCELYYIVVWLTKPYYMEISPTLKGSKDRLRKKILHYYRGGYDRHHLSLSKCRVIREDYVKGASIKGLCKKYRIKYHEMLHIVRNTRWTDSTYVPPPPRFGRGCRTRILVEIFSETKCMAEWASDPRCQVSYQTLKLRYKAGIRGEPLLKFRYDME